MGCTMAQGPFVGEPVPAEGLDRLLNPEAYAEAQAPPAAPELHV
jgi:EAL domain-containing protein (putative c-di-GMP-specific phosphodiesterase class I)